MKCGLKITTNVNNEIVNMSMGNAFVRGQNWARNILVKLAMGWVNEGPGVHCSMQRGCLTPVP